MRLLAKTFLGLEGVLADEIKNLGATNIKKERRAVSFEGDLAMLYKANIWLRTATRILLPIATFRADDADEVYENVKRIEWEQYMSVGQTFAVDTTVYSDIFRHSKFVAYRAKDAIADYFRDKFDKRPSVRLTNPDIQLNVHIAHNQCTVSLDSSGESLHRRGYKVKNTQAPMSEVLAAGLILLSGWRGESDFYDFMCGSGTILIEAALIALNIPPGIFRKRFAFESWSNFDRQLFEEILEDDSQERDFKYKIYGADISKAVIDIAEANVRSTGLLKYIELNRCSVADFMPKGSGGIIISNPPYGDRLKDDSIYNLYDTIGSVLKHRCGGMQAWIISADDALLSHIGLKPKRKVNLLNGEIECKYCCYDIFAGKRKDFIRKQRT